MSLTRILAITAASLAALAALAWAFTAFQNHYIAIGDQRGAARVQGKWDAQNIIDQAESLRLQQEASADQLIKFRNAERISDEQAKRDAVRERLIAGGNAVADSLRSTIETLNQRDMSTAAGDPRSVALAQEAATARALFGSCNRAQLDLAADADRLRDQVAGLQDDAMYVCRAPKQTNNNLTNKQTTESAFEHPDN